MPMRQRTSALGRLMLAGLFAVAPRLFVSIAVHGLAHDTGAPRTLFAITHKRDLDAFAPLPRLLGHRGWRAFTSDVHFAMRADAFQSGFLARVVQHPGWFARLLRPISVGPVLRAVGVHPLDSLHFRPAETWLREALVAEGDVAIGTLLAPDALASIAAAAGDDPAALAQRPLSALLAWRYFRPLQPQLGSELFRGPARRRAEAPGGGGRDVDRRLRSEAGGGRCVGRYLRSAERRGLLRRHSAAFALVPGALGRPDAAATSAAAAELGYRSSPLQYGWAEAQE